MEKLNKSGRTLLKYRIEYKKHYATKIDNALKEAISILYKNKNINEFVFRNIFNEDISDDAFEGMLLKIKKFSKNQNELNSEFDKIRKKVNEYMFDINFIKGMSTKNSINFNKIIIIHEFDLNRNFMTSYFGVNNSEMVPLMRRRGFIEKFSVLRLNKVLKEIYNEVTPIDDFQQDYSLVYYNKDTKSFSIDYKYCINIELLKNDEEIHNIVNKIKDIDENIIVLFKQKIGEQYLKESDGLNNQQQPIINVEEKPTTIEDPVNIVNSIKSNKNLYNSIENRKNNTKDNNIVNNINNQKLTNKINNILNQQKDNTKENTKDNIKDNIKDNTKEIIKEDTKDNTKDNTKENIKNNTKDKYTKQNNKFKNKNCFSSKTKWGEKLDKKEKNNIIIQKSNNLSNTKVINNTSQILEKKQKQNPIFVETDNKEDFSELLDEDSLL